MKSISLILACLLIFSIGGVQAQTAKKPATPQNAGATAPKPAMKPAQPATARPTVAKTAPTAPVLKLTPEKEKASYSIGVDIGRNLKQQEIDLDPAAAARGLRDFLSSQKLLLTDQEITDSMQNLRQSMTAKMQEKMKGIAAKNKMDGDRYLAENKGKPGVITLPSGLQYKEIVAGTGPSPKATDTVETNYRGTLINGSEFDS
jgi:hypothetical protein